MAEEAVVDDVVQEGVTDAEPVTEPFNVDMDAFRESLPEEVRSAEIIKNAHDVGAIAKMAVDNNSKIGQRLEDFIKSIPQNGDDPTAVDRAYTKLGWPGKEGTYEVTRPEEIEGLAYNEDMEAKFLEVAKANRLNGSQVNAIIQMQHEFNKAQLEQNINAANEANEQLKADWGSEYEANKNEVKSLLEKFGDDSLISLFNETELGSHTGFIKLIHSLGSGMIEKGAVGHGDAAHQSVLAKDEAQKQIAANYADQEFMDAYWNTSHPQYKEKREEMHRLHQAVHGKQVVTTMD